LTTIANYVVISCSPALKEMFIKEMEVARRLSIHNVLVAKK